MSENAELVLNKYPFQRIVELEAEVFEFESFICVLLLV